MTEDCDGLPGHDPPTIDVWAATRRDGKSGIVQS